MPKTYLAARLWGRVDPTCPGRIEMARNMPRPSDGPLVYVKMQKRVRVVQQVEWTPKVLASPLAA